MELRLEPGELAICRLESEEPVPPWAEGAGGPILSVTRTRDELSIVAARGAVPAGVRCETGWRAMAVRGPLDLSLTGVLASLAGPLADAGVPVFVVSTFDTDWLLVREGHLERAVVTLEAAGHQVEG